MEDAGGNTLARRLYFHRNRRDEDMSENQGTATNTATTPTLLQKCMSMLGVTDTEYEDEIQDLIDAAKADLGIAGVTKADVETDPLVKKAIKTYVAMNFGEGTGGPDNHQQLRESYETQKKQLKTATGYTDWADGSEDDSEEDPAEGGDG